VLQPWLNVEVTLRSLRGAPPLTSPVTGVLAKGYYAALRSSASALATGASAASALVQFSALLVNA
jgi:hypothetical protein